MLTDIEIEMIAELLIDGGYLKDDALESFREWLGYMGGGYLESERKASQAKERYYARHVMCEPGGTDMSMPRRVQSLLERIAYSGKRGNAQGTWNQVALLLGDFWEANFCAALSGLPGRKVFTHRFLKDHLVGSAAMGWGEDRVVERHGMPNIMLEAGGTWAFADVRHTTYSLGSQDIPFGLYYCLKPREHERLMEMTYFQRPIPVIVAIHDYKALGKWGLENRLEDWLAQELTTLGTPLWIKTRRTPSRFEREELMTNGFFHKDGFRPLSKLIAELRLWKM